VTLIDWPAVGTVILLLMALILTIISKRYRIREIE
jgi:hypothetical protein